MPDGSPPLSVVDGRYDVRERIGSGGFATVWRAVDREGGPPVAVKFPDAEADDATVSARFQQEYDLHAAFEGSLLPASIARFVGGSRDDPAYIAVEYLRGADLSTHLAETGVAPGMAAARTYGVPVVRGLEFLHRNGYCYLDCKPANVVVREQDDSPVLVDFNTAVSTEGAGATLFYPDDYKPPEQTPDTDVEGDVGPWSDVYAAGKLVCYLLCGMRMSTDETPPDGIDPRDHGAACPDGVARSVRRATAADPTRRPATAGEFLASLRRATEGETPCGRLTDAASETVCPVRPGDGVGRVTADGVRPAITLADPDRFVSPAHLRFSYDGGWYVEDTSLNGTYVDAGDGWTYLLSESGYDRLRARDHDRVADGKPQTRLHVTDSATISPVDPSYSVTFEFDAGSA